MKKTIKAFCKAFESVIWAIAIVAVIIGDAFILTLLPAGIQQVIQAVMMISIYIMMISFIVMATSVMIWSLWTDLSNMYKNFREEINK